MSSKVISYIDTREIPDDILTHNNENMFQPEDFGWDVKNSLIAILVIGEDAESRDPMTMKTVTIYYKDKAYATLKEGDNFTDTGQHQELLCIDKDNFINIYKHRLFINEYGFCFNKDNFDESLFAEKEKPEKVLEFQCLTLKKQATIIQSPVFSRVHSEEEVLGILHVLLYKLQKGEVSREDIVRVLPTNIRGLSPLIVSYINEIRENI